MKTKNDLPRQPGSNAREVPESTAEETADNRYLLYTTPKGLRQETQRKMRLIAALFCGMFLAILAVAGWLCPALIPWIEAPFAVAGVWKFFRVTYVWMTTTPEEKLW